jgi:hypothetical protein
VVFDLEKCDERCYFINLNVILSTSMLFEEGFFKMERVELSDAKEFAKTAKEFAGHSTVRVLDIEPCLGREVCDGFDNALVIKVRGRVEFGREYSREEIEEIGFDIYLIQNLTNLIESIVGCLEND